MTKRFCYNYPIRREPEDFMAQTVLPSDLTAKEAKRLCAFIMSLAIPEREETPEEIIRRMR
jgi:cytochrome c1